MHNCNDKACAGTRERGVAVGAGVDGDGDGGVPQDSVHSGVGGSKQWHHSRFVQFLKQEIREAFSLGSWCSPSHDDPLASGTDFWRESIATV